MSRSKKSPLLQHLDKIDMNTRAIAKVVSAVECVKDDDGKNIADQQRAIDVLDDLKFQLIQERRNLRVWLEQRLKDSRKWLTETEEQQQKERRQ